MKLWEIKGQALKLMFADNDIQYSEEDFSSNALENNSNTRDKLIRMNDSINRALDLYYQYCGQYTRRKEFKFNNGFEEAQTLDKILPTYEGKINLKGNDDIGELLELIYNGSSINYHYDVVDKEISVDQKIHDSFYKEKVFTLVYRMKEMNVPFGANDIDFDFDDIYIPEDVQRMIPMYIKGELYEEDEMDVATYAKNAYVQFLMSRGRNSNKKTNRVRKDFKRER